MRNLRTGLHKQTTKYLVAALVLANCVGIYVAQESLNRPYAGPSADTSGTVADFAEAVPAMSSSGISDPMMSYSAMDAARDLGADAGPPPSAIAISGTLPDLAALPPLRVEAAPVIPSVTARAARIGRSDARAVRFRAAMPQAERGFESAFTPDYSALAPYDGSTEAAGLAETVLEANATGASEVRSEAISMDSTTAPSPAAEAISEGPVSAPAAQDVAAPAELPAVQPVPAGEALPG